MEHDKLGPSSEQGQNIYASMRKRGNISKFLQQLKQIRFSSKDELLELAVFSLLKPQNQRNFQDHSVISKFLDHLEFVRKLKKYSKNIVQNIAHVAQYKFFQRGATIFNEGDLARHFFIIMEGELAVLKEVKPNIVANYEQAKKGQDKGHRGSISQGSFPPAELWNQGAGTNSLQRSDAKGGSGNPGAPSGNQETTVSNFPHSNASTAQHSGFHPHASEGVSAGEGAQASLKQGTLAWSHRGSFSNADLKPELKKGPGKEDLFSPKLDLKWKEIKNAKDYTGKSLIVINKLKSGS